MAKYEVNREELRSLMGTSGEVFFGFYLGEQLTLDVPDFHLEIWDECVGYLNRAWKSSTALSTIHKKLFGVPRGHAKSTIARLLGVYAFLFTESRFLLYASDTFAVALAGIKDIKNMMLSESHQALWGEVKVTKSSDTEGLYILTITHAHGQIKDVILRAVGRGTQIRGTLINNRRPDFLIFDDIESEESAGTLEQQAKAAQGFCLFIGNMINEKTLLARLAKEEAWNATVFGCIIRHLGKIRSLWPEFRSLDSLLSEYAAYRRIGRGHVFESEMMNLTSSDIFGETLAGVERYAVPDPTELSCGFICLDPAFGLKAWNDESAITVHARLWGGEIPLIIDSARGRFGEEALFDEMLAKSYYWGISTWVIESVAAQCLLIPLFRSFCVQRKIQPEIFTMLPVQAGRGSKASRIVAFRSVVSAGSYGVVESQEELLSLLEVYTPESTDHDDLCDSAAYGTQIWDLYGKVVESNGWQHNIGRLMYGAESEIDSDSITMGVP